MKYALTEKQLAASREARANSKRLLILVDFYTQDQQNDPMFNHRMIEGLQKQFRDKIILRGRYAPGAQP